jgi:hypothetical protein
MTRRTNGKWEEGGRRWRRKERVEFVKFQQFSFISVCIHYDLHAHITTHLYVQEVATMVYARALICLAAAVHCYATEPECGAETVAKSVNLGTAGSFAVLAKAGVTNVVPSAITGDLGVSPIAAAAVTGKHTHKDTHTHTYTHTQSTNKDNIDIQGCIP